ncbi:MAG: hypothetical protein U0798_09515 [Gemmataceae bacterium]
MARSTRDDDDDYDPGFDARPRRKSSSGGTSTVKVLVIVFGIIGLLTVLVCGGLIGYGVYIYQPKWSTYTSPDGAYVAKFPKANPTVRNGNGPDNVAFTGVESTHGFPPSLFFIRVSDVNAAEARNASKLLNQKADSWAKDGKKTTEVSRAVDEYHGYPSLDLVLNRPSDKVIVLRFVLVGTKLYTIGVDSNFYDETDDPVTDFLDSFEPAAMAPVNKK